MCLRNIASVLVSRPGWNGSSWPPASGLRHVVTAGGGLAILCVLAFGAYKFPQVLPKSLANIIRPAEVTTALVQVAPVSEAVYGTGTVEPERWAKVVPLQRRRLLEICRCEGQAVRAGQVLARQDDAEERNLLQELEINHEQLDRNLRRARDDKAPTRRNRTEGNGVRSVEIPHRSPARTARQPAAESADGRPRAAARRRSRRDRRTDRSAVLGRPADAAADRRRDQRGRDRQGCGRAKGLPANRGVRRASRCARRLPPSRRRATRRARRSASTFACRRKHRCASA